MNELEQIVYALQDKTYLSWSLLRRSSGTAGSFLKSYEETPDGKYYYKLSNYDPYRGIIGHECVNEIIADRLLTILGIEHLSYQLMNAEILLDGKRLKTWLSVSKDFKKKGESKIALDAFYQLERQADESPMDFCKRFGWETTVYEMLVVDYLILNRDRHGANMEVLRNRNEKTIRLAPLFDHGLSLLFRCETVEEAEKEDVLDDKPVQCFIGSRSARKNLELIPRELLPMVRPLRKTDRSVLLDGLENVLPVPFLNRIWEMIYSRWESYENFCNQR